ncbi:MAG TPA: HAD family hydrolase [Actinoplanes sp.]|nr:HAD family hydrolase [Actinoplanes sp.]
MLIFDGDDTLWENNILFERVIDDVMELVDPVHPRPSVRAHLNRIERKNSDRYGYGVEIFQISLLEMLTHYHDESTREADVALIGDLCRGIVEAPLELIDGVPETLASLSRRNELLLLTKGHTAEQRAKIDASGLSRFFDDVLIVPEKTVAVYEELVGKRDTGPERTWMIGNSPRSDILPARAAGLGTVLIPHHATWELEVAEVPPQDERFRVVETFPSLTGLF